jgi:hypothetical protein
MLERDDADGPGRLCALDRVEPEIGLGSLIGLGQTNQESLGLGLGGVLTEDVVRSVVYDGVLGHLMPSRCVYR